MKQSVIHRLGQLNAHGPGYKPHLFARAADRFYGSVCSPPTALLLLVMLSCADCTWAQQESILQQSYPTRVKEVLEQRCVVCHGCYDAPCQLKMDAWAGIVRGGNKNKVYDGGRLRPANLTRLYEDALSIEQWRAKEFYPALDNASPTDGLIHSMLRLKEAHPLPAGEPLPASFDVSLDREQSCPTQDEFQAYASERPLQGMPFGLPALDEDRLGVLTGWLEAGAPGVAAAQTPRDEIQAVERWEAFFNGDSVRARLVSRYIYEHLFIGSLYFDDLQERSAWYTLVRSRTAPGKPIDIIATRRPYDDPGDAPFYYRLQPRDLSPLAKRHMPYALNDTRMRRWRELFFEPDYDVNELPGYEGVEAANPFITFEQLPVDARYSFMLDEAHFTIMAYIKGPVCRGQVALNVIDDHFWVAFIKPNPVDPEQHSSFLATHAREMRIPQARKSLVVTLLTWRNYGQGQQRYLKAQAEAVDSLINQRELSLNIDLLWNGGPEQNDNAALTVFRHFDSATVVKGFIGEQPKTMWVIDYSLLERIHYLLVAGFDVYGPVGHQLESRLYMDFLRMEGEQAFLLFLPEESRDELREFWYREAQNHVKDYLFSKDTRQYERPTALTFLSDDPKAELMDAIAAHIPSSAPARYAVMNRTLKSLMGEADESFSYLPEVSFIQVLKANGERDYYTLIHNRALKNNAHLFKEADRRIPEEDNVTVVRDFLGAYPNMYFQLHESELGAFVNSIRALQSDGDYTALVERFGVRRTAPWFWKLSDDMHAHYRSTYPNEAGLFDLNRYQNR